MALSAYLLRAVQGAGVPARITLADLNPRNLEACREVHARLPRPTELLYRESNAERANDRLLAELPPGSMVVNASGLGKDRPGSPLSDQALFPQDGFVWEFNYRGELEFLAQARRQQAGRRLSLEDGLVYFIFGWALGIEEVFGRKLGPEDLSALCRVTYAYLGSPPDRRPCG
jgi:shikimate 5-dehydrogenase